MRNVFFDALGLKRGVKEKERRKKIPGFPSL
jgi:hypothetical protein